jgi:hypothetical protein
MFQALRLYGVKLVYAKGNSKRCLTIIASVKSLAVVQFSPDDLVVKKITMEIRYRVFHGVYCLRIC